MKHQERLARLTSTTLPIPCPVVPRLNPAAQSALTYLPGLLQEAGCWDDRIASIVDGAGLDVAVGVSFPEAPPHRLQIAALWYVFLIWIDDFWDNLDVHSDGWRPKAHRMIATIRSMNSLDSPIVAEVPARFLGLIMTYMSAEPDFDHQRFLSGLSDYLDAVLWELDMRERSLIPDLQTYLRMRRYYSTMYLQLEVANVVDGLRLSRPYRSTPAVQALDASAADYGCLVNDYYSLQRERDNEHSQSNVILVLKADWGVSTSEAIRLTRQLISRIADAVVLNSESLFRDTPSVKRSEVSQYVEHHHNFMAAAAYWPHTSTRYAEAH